MYTRIYIYTYVYTHVVCLHVHILWLGVYIYIHVMYACGSGHKYTCRCTHVQKCMVAPRRPPLLSADPCRGGAQKLRSCMLTAQHYAAVAVFADSYRPSVASPFLL